MAGGVRGPAPLKETDPSGRRLPRPSLPGTVLGRRRHVHLRRGAPRTFHPGASVPTGPITVPASSPGLLCARGRQARFPGDASARLP